jgi:hypothetical protein
MHVFVNGILLFFDVEGAKLVPDGPAMRENRPCSCFMGARASTIRSTNPPTRLWLRLPRSSISIIAVVPDAPERAIALIREFIPRH